MEEPAFIKRFKAQTGMRPSADIESKKAALMRASDGDFRDREDEAPQVVAGVGVTQEEAQTFVNDNLSKTEKGGDDKEDEPTPEEIEAEKAGT